MFPVSTLLNMYSSSLLTYWRRCCKGSLIQFNLCSEKDYQVSLNQQIKKNVVPGIETFKRQLLSINRKYFLIINVFAKKSFHLKQLHNSMLFVHCTLTEHCHNCVCILYMCKFNHKTGCCWCIMTPLETNYIIVLSYSKL